MTFAINQKMCATDFHNVKKMLPIDIHWHILNIYKNETETVNTGATTLVVM